MNAWGRPSRALAMAACVALSAGAGLARAQTLDLTPPATPQPGDFAAATALAMSLEEEAARIRAGRESLGIDAFDVAIRELAAKLLRESTTSAGASRPDAARRVVLAMTLSRRSDDLGAWLDAFTPPAPAIEASAKDLEALRDHTNGLDADALCRGVRNALAPMWPTTSRVYAAWSPDAALRAPIEQSTSIAPPPDWLAPEAVPALARLTRLVEAAMPSPAYAHAARLMAYRETAARQFASAPPGAFDAAATQTLRDAYAAAIHAAAPVPGESALADPLPLARLAMIASLVRDASAIPPAPGPRNLAPDPVRAVNDHLAAILREPAPASLRRLDIALDLVRQASPEPLDDTPLPRQLRVVLRQLQPAAAASRAALIETSVRVLDPATSLSDPAVLGAPAIHRNRVNDITLLFRAARAITVASDEDPGPEGPKVKPDLAPVSAYLLRLGQDLGKAEMRDAALVTLRETCETIATAWATPSEESLRQSPDASDARIVARLDAARSAYALALADPRRRDAQAPAGELRAIGAALTLREECELDAPTLAGLLDWPGFELSARAIDALRDDARAAGDAAINAVAVENGADLDARAALDAIAAARERSRPWRCVVTLARAARTQSAVPDLSNSLSGATSFPFAECGAGAPDPAAWMHGSIDDLAEFCRYAEEWALAHAAKDAKSEAMFDRSLRAAVVRLGIE